jgi:hypothetical protein
MTHRFSLSLVLSILAVCSLVACSDSTTSPSPPPTSSTGAPASPTPGPAPEGSAEPTARYRMEFRATWSRQTHPVDFPDNAHFSPLVGGTHTASASFWREATLATAGIRDMAERGRTSPLDAEIRAAIAAGSADQVITGDDVDRSPGSTSLEFEMRREFPLVTMVTMVAPSPDWFVGVTGLALFENGVWTPARGVELVAWDAGTDSGATFTSADRATSPPALISRILSAPLAPSGQPVALGSFSFTRLQ